MSPYVIQALPSGVSLARKPHCLLKKVLLLREHFLQQFLRLGWKPSASFLQQILRLCRKPGTSQSFVLRALRLRQQNTVRFDNDSKRKKLVAGRKVQVVLGASISAAWGRHKPNSPDRIDESNLQQRLAHSSGN